jgi:NADH dehydrogenase [ubiquinone] 1 alpha subcomplex assembly factor 5
MNRLLRIGSRRLYATLSPYTPPPTAAYEVFDEPSKARQRDRALLRLPDAKVVDYLREELAERLLERIEVTYSLWLLS